MRVSLIVAHSLNRAIGHENKIPWRLKNDMKFFKDTTVGHAVIMGRNTWDSLPAKAKPLPNRTNVVISSRKLEKPGDVSVFADIDQALLFLAFSPKPPEEVFFIGGYRIYQEAIKRSSRMYITQVDAIVPGDVYFPEYDEDDWKLVRSAEHLSDSDNEYSHRICIFDRAVSR